MAGEGGAQVVLHGFEAGHGGSQKLIVKQLPNLNIGRLYAAQVELGHFIGLLQRALLQLEQVLAVLGEQGYFDFGVWNIGDVAHGKQLVSGRLA